MVKPLILAAPKQSLRSRLLSRGSIAAQALDQSWIERGRREAIRQQLGVRSVGLQAANAFVAGITSGAIEITGPVPAGTTVTIGGEIVELDDGSQA